jgi:simple sugar transport system permease protein
MLWGGIGDWSRFVASGDVTALTRPWGETGVKSSLLLLTGLSVAVAFRAGLFNIGAQGQLLWGALAAALVGAKVQLVSPLHVASCLGAAAGAGALWALIPTALKLHRGVHEVISTIMLNWVASSLVESWLVVGPFRARAAEGHSASGTDEILATAALPRLLGESSRLHAGVLVGLGLAVLVGLWLWRTRAGFEVRAVGLSPDAAAASGLSVARRTYEAMAVAGALAGLAGAVLVLGTEHKVPATLSAPHGFDGIAIALLGQSHPLGVVLTSAWFGALRAGGTRMQLFGVHKSFPEIVQGLALLFISARLVWDGLSTRLMRRPGR